MWGFDMIYPLSCFAASPRWAPPKGDDAIAARRLLLGVSLLVGAGFEKGRLWRL